MRLILASSSPRRQALLSQLGLRFEVMKPAINEARLADEPLVAYAERLSREKAAAVADLLEAPSALILAADTIVIDHEGGLLGKPADASDARRMLRHLRNRRHQVVTAFTIRQSDSPTPVITRHARSVVYMRDYSEAEIDAYVASGDPLDKAGAYAIQNEAFQPVARVEGSYSNVVGLPLEPVEAALLEMGRIRNYL